MTDYTDASWSADDLEFKAVSGQLNVDEARGIVECFVAAVGNKDSVGDIVAPGAFDGSLRRRKPRVVWGHDWNQPIGKVLAIEEVPSSDSRLPEKMQAARVGGLLARVQFNLKSERGREAFYSVAFFGTDQEWSIGYKTIKAAYDPTAQANVLQEVELFEVSPVLHGANQLTGTISIKSMHGDMGMDESEDSNDPKGYDSEWSDWADKDDDSYEMPERDESPAESFVGRRRVRMVMGEHGIGEIYSGSNRHQVSLDELNNDGSSINGEDRPGLGGAVSKAVNSSIQMRITQPNFVIFDMASEDGDMDTFFMPYHYDAQGGQYMFGDSMEVEVEMNVKFGMGSDEEYESDGKSAYDPALSADDFEDLEEKSLSGRIGRGIVPGGGDNPLRGRNPRDVVDRNNDGWLFSGPNRIRAVDRTGPDAGGQAGIEEDLNIGMERLKRIALADRKKPAKKPASLTSNRMEKPSKPSTQMTYAERAAERKKIDRAKAEAAEARRVKFEADRKAGMDRAEALRAKRDLAKVNEAEGHAGNGWKGQPYTRLSDPKSLIIKPNSTNNHDGDTLDPDILDQVKEGDVVTFDEPGKDAMSSGVVRQILVNMDDNEDMDYEDKIDLNNSPNFEIYVTHFDGVPIAESQRYTVRAGGASEPDPGTNDAEMDLGELVNGLRVFKGK